MPTELPLEPCPFCGGPADTDGWDKRDDDGAVVGYGFIVGCMNGDCPVQPTIAGDSEKQETLIEQWNERKAATPNPLPR